MNDNLTWVQALKYLLGWVWDLFLGILAAVLTFALVVLVVWIIYKLVEFVTPLVSALFRSLYMWSLEYIGVKETGAFIFFVVVISIIVGIGVVWYRRMW